ncbi:MAG: hypothetical protein AB1631_07850 [Acidobacteriota bacterium]
MGDTLWLEIKDGDETSGDEQDNSLMLRLQENLDALAEALGVPKLSQFFDYSLIAAEFDEAGGLPDEAWFDAKDGLLAVDRLYTHLIAHFDDLGLRADQSQAHWPDGLLEELSYCRARLAEAVERGARFRLLIVS